MVENNVIGFDVSMNEANNLVAVVKCLEHVNDVLANFVRIDATSLYWFSLFK